MDRRSLARAAFLVVIFASIAAAYFSPLAEWLTLAGVKESQAWMVELIEARPLLYAMAFFVICVVATAACFPAAPIIGISAGALFGFWTGLFLVLLATSIGSTIAFFDSRYLLRDWVKAKFAARLDAIDRGFDRHGAGYLLALRFNPVIPYWLVNLAMGVTKMRFSLYLPLTVIGLFPATFIYIHAGSRLSALDTASDILSPGLLAAFFLLSLFPLLLSHFRKRLAPTEEEGLACAEPMAVIPAPGPEER